MIKNIKRAPNQKIKGEITPPPDKSISHRSIIFAAIGKGRSKINNLLEAKDCLNTLNAFEKMGISIKKTNETYIIEGNGLFGLKKPEQKLDCGNSGTTIRLLAGLLAGQNDEFVLDGDQSLRKRPMQRIIKPLSKMGADIITDRQNGFAPLKIKGKKLKAINYDLPIASAQLKSSLLLANLYTNEKMCLKEPEISRDHTEIIMKELGLDINTEGLNIEFKSSINSNIPANEYRVPGDFSQAAYFITAAILIPDSELMIKDVNLNSTRTGFLKVIKNMGANIKIFDKKYLNGEPTGNILIKSSTLKGITISKDLVPSMIDEIPLVAILALKAEGKTQIRGAHELRVKESDRINVLKKGFETLGLDIKVWKDGFAIKGPQVIDESGVLDSHLDHRMAMTFSILGLLAKYGIGLENHSCIDNSFPGFFDKLNKILY